MDQPARPNRRARAVFLLLAAALTPAAGATDLLGLSVGAGIGRTAVQVDRVSAGYPLGFDEHATGWKGYVAMRPIRFFGVEVDYVDLGHPHALIGFVNTDVRTRGAAAFAVGYLPLPLVDLYAKAGFARLELTAVGNPTTIPIDTCLPGFVPGYGCPFRIDRTDTRAAYGIGAQLKLSALTLRAELEQFDSAVGHQDFASLSLGWRF